MLAAESWLLQPLLVREGSQGDCPGCYGVEPVRADEVSLLVDEGSRRVQDPL